MVLKACQGEKNPTFEIQRAMELGQEPKGAPLSLPMLTPESSDEIRLKGEQKASFDNSGSDSSRKTIPCNFRHLVRVGDSLATIALTYDVPMPVLMEANEIGSSGLIYVGQNLCIPGPLTTPTPTVVATSTVRPTPIPTSPAQTPPSSVVESETYTVKPGDTLFAIASTYHVTVAALIEFNGITDARTLRAGQDLQIPGNGTLLSNTPAPVTGQPASIPTPAPAGSLFTVQFFNNITLSGSPAFVRTDPVGWSYVWGWNGPAPGVNRNFFSASWDGSFAFPAGNYRFTVSADDGTRLYVDGALVLNNWFDQPDYLVYTAEVFLSAGVHHVRLEYYQRGERASARMNWQLLSTDVPGIKTPHELVAQPTLSRDQEPSSGQESEEAVWEALRSLDVEKLRNALQSLPDLDFARNDGWTPLHVAVNTDRADLISTILDHPAANIDVEITSGTVDKTTLLHFAVSQGNGGRLTAIKTLLQYGADLEARDSLGNTPLLKAASSLVDEAFELLLAQGANPNVQTESRGSRHGWTPLHHAAIRYQDLKPLRLLLAHPRLDPNIRNDDGLTALYQIVVNNDLEKARMLLRHQDINPDRDNKDDFTPLHYVAINGRFEMADVLLDHRDIDPNRGAGKLDWTPLHYAVRNDSAFVAQSLIEHPDIDVNAEANDEGRTTPCRLAVYLNNDYLFDRLQKAGGRRCSGYD